MSVRRALLRAIRAARRPAAKATESEAVRYGESLEDIATTMGGRTLINAIRRAKGKLGKDELYERPMRQRSVPLEELHTTDHTPPTPYVVDEMAASAGSEFDPIIVRRRRSGGYHIVDGHHRTAAAKKRGDKAIEAYDASEYF